MADKVSKRQANFELMRIVAMMMVIVLHYLGKGGILVPYAQNSSLLNHTAWLIEAFCIVSVNCYVLISGYFLVESGWKSGRIWSLIAQILFYSVLIPVIMLCLGMISVSELSIYDWLYFILPVQSGHYWFATYYVLFYIFVPILAAGVQNLEKRTLQIVIAMLFLFLSVGKTIIPFFLAIDNSGYHLDWFLCLFLVAAYIRKYGIAWLEKGKWGMILYIGMCFLIWAISAFSGMVERRTGALSHYVHMPYTYNYVFVFLASVGLFYMFRNLHIKEGKAACLIRKLAPYTFGVYLLHCHNLVKDIIYSWLGVEKVKESWLFIPHMIFCVLIIYLVGTVVDFARAWIFRVVAGCVRKKAHDK